MVDPDDGTLVARARNGDPAAFETLVRRHYRAAYAVALAALGRQTDAEDACQEAWVRALAHLDELRDPGRFRGWLLQIVRNGARNHLAGRRVRAVGTLEDDSAVSVEDPRQDLQNIHLRARLEAALAELEAAPREVLVLFDVGGWSHREIAGQLSISEVMSRQHLFQARRRLRELLGDEQEGRRS
jgi:RNA polymerase sigma-70 factor, ECF subfamily